MRDAHSVWIPTNLSRSRAEMKRFFCRWFVCSWKGHDTRSEVGKFLQLELSALPKMGERHDYCFGCARCNRLVKFVAVTYPAPYIGIERDLEKIAEVMEKW